MTSANIKRKKKLFVEHFTAISVKSDNTFLSCEMEIFQKEQFLSCLWRNHKKEMERERERCVKKVFPHFQSI